MTFFPRLTSLVFLLAALPALAAEQPADPIETPPENDTPPASVENTQPDTETGDVLPRYMLNRIVAVVNTDVVMYTELDQAMSDIVIKLNEQGTQMPEQGVLTRQVLERLVMDKLQMQIADQNGITIDDNMLNSEIQTLAKDNGVTLSEFRKILERDGYDYRRFREQLRKQLAIQQVRRQMVASRIQVSDLEIENLLAMTKASGQGDVQYHLGHILIAIPEAASPEQIKSASERADRVLERLRSGADFTETAVAASDGQKALEGGDIGWRSIGQIPSLFVDSVERMQVGETSEPLRSSSGFHIVKLHNKRGGERHMIKQTRARHILLKTDALNSDDKVKLRMEQLEIRIRSGEDFGELALANSQDTLSAAKGGDLGWVGPGDTVPEFEDVMNKLAPGEISEPFTSQFGWHLLQVLERREHDSTVEYERARARQLIQSRKYDEELFLWLRRLRDESYVEYRIEET